MWNLKLQKRTNTQERPSATKNNLMDARGEGVEGMDDKEGEHEAQTSRYKISQPQGCSAQHREYVNNILITLTDGNRASCCRELTLS